MYFKEFSCKITENMQARCVPRFIQRFPKCLKGGTGSAGTARGRKGFDGDDEAR